MVLKKMRAGLGVALSAVLLTGLLGACGASAYDPVKEVMGYPSSTVMFTVNGTDVTAGEYFFWMAQNADYVQQYYTSMGTTVDWTEDAGNGTTMDDYVKNEAKQTAIVYSIVAAKAKENGYTFTDEDQTEYEAQTASAKESSGGDEEYANMLKSMCITEEGMQELSKIGVVYSHMQEGMCREGGEYAATAEDLEKYAEDNDLLYAKHILLLTQNSETGAVMTDAEKAAQLTKANEILAQLQAITDPTELATKFDELMNANSEDTGLQSKPDGYTFTAGEMVEQFEAATRALEVGKISDIVETDYGYHIIMRLDPATSADVQQKWEDEQMDTLLQQWVEEAEVVTTETFDNLTTADFYTKLTAFRETFAADTQTAEGETNTVEGATEEPIQDDAVGEGAIQEGTDTTTEGTQETDKTTDTTTEGAQTEAPAQE